MRKTFFHLLGFLTVAALVLSACNLPSATSEVTAQPSATATIPTATQTAAPTETTTVTSTETMTPEPSATATPQPPMADVLRESNCRSGPGGLHELVAKYPVGQEVEIVARDLGGGYWFVRNPQKPEEQCYLLGQNIKITGETTALPQFTPLPSPTAPPDVKITFKKFDVCEGSNYALFVVENVGSVPFRSAYIRVTNRKLNQVVEQSLNAFDMRVKCVLAKNIAPLNPGGTGYVASPKFTWSGRGQKLQAVIMICAEKDLKGACVTKTIEIKD